MKYRKLKIVTLGALITITLVQVLGGYKPSYISSVFVVRKEAFKVIDSNLIVSQNVFSEVQTDSSGKTEIISTNKVDQITQHSSEPCLTCTVAEKPKQGTKDVHQTTSNVKQAYTILEHCPTIHIAMVLYSHTENWSIYLAIKSILMYRSTKLHFHFVTDNRTKTVLHAILSSWQVPGITHDYYDLAQASESIRKTFTDSPTANCFGTLSIKLNLHSVLPDSVQHVLVIEPTSIVNADLFELWSVTVSCADHVITLCSEKCVSYCHRGTTVLHDNTREDVLLHGAMGLNLDRIRSSSPAKNWTEIVENVYLCRPNAIETVYNTFTWPTSSSVIANCLERILALNDRSQNQELFTVCRLVHEYDGNLLRYKDVKQCSEIRPMVKVPPNAEEDCEVFAWERVVRRRELPFLLGHSYSSSDEYDVTLDNHVDYDRVSLIERSLTNWDGPVSIAIQVTDSQVPEVIDFILNSPILRERKNISYHLLFRIGPSYPINALRSLAHRYVSTPYVFFSDIDYVSSYGMYKTIKKNLKQLGNVNKTAIVIPTFETDRFKFSIPHNKLEMLELFSLGVVQQFHVASFPKGQRPTNYTRWTFATEPYYIVWVDMYEPYCVLKTSVFSFDPRFVARFHDKASHITELHMAGYKFLVLHDCFIIHLPHPVNKQNVVILRTCSRQWYRDWVIEKKEQYKYEGDDVLEVFGKKGYKERKRKQYNRHKRMYTAI